MTLLRDLSAPCRKAAKAGIDGLVVSLKIISGAVRYRGRFTRTWRHTIAPTQFKKSVMGDKVTKLKQNGTGFSTFDNIYGRHRNRNPKFKESRILL